MPLPNKVYLNQYIYSPVTKYHIINTYIKIFFVYATMFIILYSVIDQILVIILLMLVCSTLTFLLFNKNIKFTFYQIIRNNIFYLLNICIINYWMKENQISIEDIAINKYIMPYKIKIDLSNKTCQFTYYCMLYFIPKYLMKIFYVYTICSNLSQILFIFTQSHSIIETLIYYFNQISVFTKITYNKYITNLYLAYQSLEHIINIWTNNSIGKQIKTKYFIKYTKINILITLITLCNNVLFKESNTSIVIWNRNLFYKNFIIFKYHY
uniref:Uncharacterized protein n=1 Tax=Chondria sp. (in: red algae) TaxID=1982705 RepID=A0A1Z1MD81_9FLOR|nr:hypothetical protein [Chondria sp. (in: red algae)]